MNSITLILPEILLALTLVGLLVSEIGYHGERSRLNAGISLVGIAAAWIQLWILYSQGPVKAFGDGFYLDGPAFFFKNLFLILAFYTVLVSLTSREVGDGRRSEYYAMIVGACLAMSLCASAGDILVAVIALQAMHLAGFALAGFSKRSPLSVEAAMKTLLPGALAFMLLLVAAGILFYRAQTLNLAELKNVLAANPLPKESALTLFLLMLIGVSFPILSFPMFHWVPDGLQGAPTPVSPFIAIGFRGAGFALLLRWVLFLFAQPSTESGGWVILGAWNWSGVLSVVAAATMLTGPLLALQQKSAKRLVGALIAGETGVLLLGVLVLNRLGLGALLYSLFTQLFAVMGVYFVLSRIWDLTGDDRLDCFSGLLRRCRIEILGLALFLICMIGLPPSPGFVGKFALIGAVLHQGWPVLAGVAVLSTFLSAIAVFRLIYSCIGDFRASAADPRAALSWKMEMTEGATLSRSLTLVALVAPLILLGIGSDWFLRWATQSINLILW